MEARRRGARSGAEVSGVELVGGTDLDRGGRQVNGARPQRELTSMDGAGTGEGEIRPTSRGAQRGPTAWARTMRGRAGCITRAGARSVQTPQSERAMQTGAARVGSILLAGDSGRVRPGALPKNIL